MRFYWSLKSIPELSTLTPEQRRRVWRRARTAASWGWPSTAGVAGCGVLAGVGGGVGGALGLLGGLALGVLVLLHLQRWQTLPYIRLDIERRHPELLERDL